MAMTSVDAACSGRGPLPGQHLHRRRDGRGGDPRALTGLLARRHARCVTAVTRTLPRVYNDRPGPLTKRSRDAYRHVPGKKWAGRRLSVTDVRRREADVGSFNPWRKSHGRLFGRALSDGLSLAISAVSRTSDGHKSGLIALNAPGTFRRLQGFSSCKQIVSAPAVRDWSGQAMFHRIFVHLHTSGSPFAKYGSWLAPAQPHQDQFCESSIGVLIV